MQIIGRKIIAEYRYESEEEAKEHEQIMKLDGWRVEEFEDYFIKHFRSYSSTWKYRVIGENCEVKQMSVLKEKKVYNDRTGETLFIGTELECIKFIDNYSMEKPDDIDYIWIGNNDEI